jgi:hypothetical protein
MRVTRVYVECARSRPLGSSAVHLITPSALKHTGREQIFTSFAHFHSCNRGLHGRTCNMLCQILSKLIDNNWYVLTRKCTRSNNSIAGKYEIIPTRIVNFI